MSAVELTQPQARALHLAAQGLLTAPAKKATRAQLVACIAKMQLLQIDTIHVVARSPYLVLFSRLGSYPQHWLDAALSGGKVFETWAHEACFAPMADLALHRVYNREARAHWGLAHARKTHASQRKELDALLAHIDSHGAVKSSDFERTGDRTSAWWGWKDEKRWLEALFASGELMVARREAFQRVYDAAHRVAPAVALQDEARWTPSAVQQCFVEKSIAALGVTQARWINDYFRTKPRLRDADLQPLVDSGAVLRVAVQGWEVPGYVHASHTSLLRKACAGKLQATHTVLLSPFDPLVWDRERVAALFGFDYRLECYTPAARRVHGYFVLPILCQGELIGRLDAKAHRAEGIFEVKLLHTQPGLRWTDAQVMDVAQAVQSCADWHVTPQVRIASAQPAALATRLKQAWKLLATEADPH
jgi:uncharacterized protein YcaQ